ncbi:MAG: 16S rRNA (guanine(527)-N(7))-methyltransferase RsmG, partial [Acidimicrobiia bacterium]|nr:16S rRNA (guanine(527)-N(7))-methyltransferase RsmG [Acidimicrobiia bacterium]
MFHGKHVRDRLDRAAGRAGTDLSSAQHETLIQFADWLATEAVEAGGIGSDELDRIIDRHVADALVFAAAWKATPVDILDIGSGVGLPGIPLAILHPTTSVTLLDRSEKRCRLARRAIRILGLENVVVEQGDIQGVRGSWSTIVFRASLVWEDALATALPLLAMNGCAVVGLSRSAEPDQLP